MGPVESFHSGRGGETGLDVYLDHIRIRDAEVPYERIAHVAVAGPDPDALFDLSRVILQLDDGEELVIRLPRDEAELARRLIAVPEARREAMLQPAFDREPRRIDPLDDEPLFPLESEERSTPLEQVEGVGIPAEPDQEDLPPPIDETDFFPPEPDITPAPPPPVPLLLHEIWRSASPNGQERAHPSSDPNDVEGRPRRRGPADVVFGAILVAAAVTAVLLLLVPHRAHHPAPPARAEAKTERGTSAAPPAQREPKPHGVATSTAPAHHRHHKAKKPAHKRSSGGAGGSTVVTQPVVVPSPQATAPATTAPPPPPAPSPKPPPPPKPSPKPKPSISISQPPVTSPSISPG